MPFFFVGHYFKVGTIFMVLIAVIILACIAKLFKISVSQEDFDGCFTIISWIAIVITLIVFICNKCSEAG